VHLRIPPQDFGDGSPVASADVDKLAADGEVACVEDTAQMDFRKGRHHGIEMPE
jgi:hypothetical protein